MRVLRFQYNVVSKFFVKPTFSAEEGVGWWPQNKTVRNVVMWKGPFNAYNFCMTQFLLNPIFTRVKVKIKNRLNIY